MVTSLSSAPGLVRWVSVQGADRVITRLFDRQYNHNVSPSPTDLPSVSVAA
jgi:hypothetical protein